MVYNYITVTMKEKRFVHRLHSIIQQCLSSKKFTGAVLSVKVCQVVMESTQSRFSG